MRCRLSTIFGRRASCVSAIALFTLGTLGCALAPSFKWFIVARFIAGAGGGGMNTTGSIIISDLFTLKQRGLVGAISTMTWAVGGALGGPFGGLMSDRLGWRSAFYCSLILRLVLLIFSYLAKSSASSAFDNEPTCLLLYHHLPRSYLHPGPIAQGPTSSSRLPGLRQFVHDVWCWLDGAQLEREPASACKS